MSTVLTATYPKGIRTANYLLAAFLVVVGVFRLLDPGTGGVVGAAQLFLVALVLVAVPARALTVVDGSTVTARRFWGTRKVRRDDVVSVTTGLFGPVVRTVGGGRVFLTTPVPQGSWLTGFTGRPPAADGSGRDLNFSAVGATSPAAPDWSPWVAGYRRSEQRTTLPASADEWDDLARTVLVWGV